MGVLSHKMFGCSAVYDKDFLRRDESGGFGAKNGRNFDERGGFWGKLTTFGFFCRASLNAVI